MTRINQYLKCSYYLLVIAICSLMTFLSFSTSIRKDTAIKIPYELKKPFKSFFPQGWSFFTRDPREANIDLYKYNREGNLNKILISGSEPTNLFGISRKARIVGYEVSNILGNIPQNKWIEKDKNNLFTSMDSIPVLNIGEKTNLQLLKKGKYLLVESKPIPWVWRNYPKDRIKDKIKVIKVQIL